MHVGKLYRQKGSVLLTGSLSNCKQDDHRLNFPIRKGKQNNIGLINGAK